jgi:hypothetical protein
MRAVKATNPFYAALLAVGVAFAITACAYGVMTVRGLDPRLADEQGLMGLMSQHGLTIMVVELVLLGVLTAAAIGTDGYWEGGRDREGEAPAEPRSDVGRREGEAPAEPRLPISGRDGDALVSNNRAEPTIAGDKR